MRSLMNLLRRIIVVGSGESPLTKVLRGIRSGDQRALYTGAALLGWGWLRRQSNERELLYRQEVPEGSGVVIRYGKKGELTGVEVRKTDLT